MHLHLARRFFFLFATVCVLTLGLSGLSAAASSKKAVSNVTPSKYASIVVDGQTGRVLSATNADDARHPASLTKMMTLYMTFAAIDRGRLSLDERLPVSAFAAEQSPTKLGLRAGETIRVRDAVLGLVTESANDAAVVLAEALGGSEPQFARMMTNAARSLGMSRTTFQNASGLPDPEQVTTARDMAILSRALIYQFPHHYQFFSTPVFSYKGASHRNHNRLMARYEGMDGIKTGFIRASGFNLAASVVRNNQRVIAVVFGGVSAAARDLHMEALLNKTFNGVVGPDDIRQQNNRIQSAANDNSADFESPATPPRPGRNVSTDTLLAEANMDETISEAPRVQSAPAKPQAGNGSLSLVTPAFAAPVPPKKPVVAAATRAQAPNKAWAVQIGAFKDQETAKNALQMAAFKAKLTSKATPLLTHVSTQDGTIYRARLEGLNEANAKKACSRLSQHGISCLPLPPQS